MFTRRQLFFAAPAFAAKASLRVATFEADVTPPKGSPLCYSLVVPAERVEAPLLAKGIVLYPSGQQPIVLCAVDWLGIGNGSHEQWRKTLARAARTSPDRVAVQTVHQHDAPGHDESAYVHLPAARREMLLNPAAFCRTSIDRVASAIRNAKPEAVTHWATGRAEVERIASNRRILSPDQKTFLFQRFTACRASDYCDAPVGTIDPILKTVSFYQSERRIASLHYYAVHPMSYYGKGVVNPDFVGIARQSLPGFHVYFTGAAGNIGAGKYNDGAPANRQVLADRLSAAMKAALASEQKQNDTRLEWRVAPVHLPHRQGEEFHEASIRRILADPKAADKDLASAARYLAWWQRCQSLAPNILLQALRLNGAAILHMPGELFIEYQLAAQAERKSEAVAVAAYGDYGPMYIGTSASYAQGGYETGPVSRVGADVQEILQSGVKTLVS
ncbi:hypothetical protein [Bryobacter aggregatus]|uniref:hypothetical protein n=1 Tax=Bryobacter aggregatus TaxID=360054 RepID=UPI00068F8258|nr:hypothetical protein [Bryobacter aggregatus]